MIRALETLRWYLLVFTLPLALVWSRSLPPTEGAIVVVLQSCLVLLWVANSSRSELIAGFEPRLSALRGREFIDRELLDIATPVLLLLTALLTLVLLIAHPWMGLFALAVALVALRQSRLDPRRKFRSVELLIPLLLIIGPAMLLRMPAWFVGDAEAAESLVVISTPVLAASWLNGALLATLIMLALIRDRASDASQGVETSATRLGRAASCVVAWAWMGGIIALAAMGAGWGWWHWLIPMLAGWTALAASASIASRCDDYAVGFAITGYGVTALALGLTTQ